MDKTPPRVHLSTLLAMTLIAGGWMVANTIEYKTTLSAVDPGVSCCGEDVNPAIGVTVSREVAVRGFPFPMHEGRIIHPGWHGPAEIAAGFNASALAWNVVSGLFAMGFVAVIMELRRSKP